MRISIERIRMVGRNVAESVTRSVVIDATVWIVGDSSTIRNCAVDFIDNAISVCVTLPVFSGPNRSRTVCWKARSAFGSTPVHHAFGSIVPVRNWSIATRTSEFIDARPADWKRSPIPQDTIPITKLAIAQVKASRLPTNFPFDARMRPYEISPAKTPKTADAGQHANTVRPRARSANGSKRAGS